MHVLTTSSEGCLILSKLGKISFWNKIILELKDTLMFIYSRSHNLFAFPNGREESWRKGVSKLTGWVKVLHYSSLLPLRRAICAMGQNLGSDDGCQNFIWFCPGSKTVRCSEPQHVCWAQIHGWHHGSNVINNYSADTRKCFSLNNF